MQQRWPRPGIAGLVLGGGAAALHSVTRAAGTQGLNRRRRQGLDEDAYGHGPYGQSARRGPVPMWRLTRREESELERLLGRS